MHTALHNLGKKKYKLSYGPCHRHVLYHVTPDRGAMSHPPSGGLHLGHLVLAWSQLSVALPPSGQRLADEQPPQPPLPGALSAAALAQYIQTTLR